jgi:hypothetical protein
MTGLRHLARKGRPWIAMIAAYAVALQMLLAAAVAGQMAAAAPGEASPICYGLTAPTDAPGHGDQAPVHQAACILCAAGLSSLPGHQPYGDLAPSYAGEGMVVGALARTVLPPSAPPSPRLSQGPPAIA